MKVLVLTLCIFMKTLLTAKCMILFEKLNSPDDICRLFPNGAVLRKPGFCKESIKCLNGQSTPHSIECSGNKIVKLDKMVCADDPEKYCAITCPKTSLTYIEDPKNCKGWIECDGSKVIKSGACPQDQIFNQDEQRCVYDDYNECNKSFDLCSVARTNQPFKNENNCREYFFCNARRQLKAQKCPPDTYYDALAGACTKERQANCFTYPLPEYACGTRKLAILDRFVSDQATCRGYLYCKDLGRSKDGNYIPDPSPAWGQCGLNDFFDAATQTCVSLNNIKCDGDRCDGHSSGRILSERSGCHHYLICQNGYTVDEVQCPDNKYFNPTEETCVDQKISYPICNENS